MASCNNQHVADCNCTASCPRHAKCCECVAHHLKSGQFPACFYSKDAEKAYDRSLAALIKDRQ